MSTLTRESEDKFIDAITRARDAGRPTYAAVAPVDAHLSVVLRLRRLGVEVVVSPYVKPGSLFQLNGVPCPECGDPIADPRHLFCDDCRRR